VTDLRKAAEGALAVMTAKPSSITAADWAHAIDALRVALEQPEPDDYDWAGRWVLREVFFVDDGDPIGHREPQQARRKWVGDTWNECQEKAWKEDKT
jgi:hypothetical protein